MSFDSILAALSPVAWWKLADNSGATSAADSSGHGKTGTLHGTITFAEPGPIVTETDTAALFDGSSGYIAAAALGTMNTWSIAAWVNPNATQEANAVIATDLFTSKVNYLIVMNPDSSLGAGTNVHGVTTGFYNGSWHTVTATTLTTSAWAFVVGTYDGTTISLYINDGTPITKAVTATPTSDGNGFAISELWSGGVQGLFGGTLGQISVFNYALTSANIAALYAARQPPLLLRMPAKSGRIYSFPSAY